MTYYSNQTRHGGRALSMLLLRLPKIPHLPLDSSITWLVLLHHHVSTTSLPFPPFFVCLSITNHTLFVGHFCIFCVTLDLKMTDHRTRQNPTACYWGLQMKNKSSSKDGRECPDPEGKHTKYMRVGK